MQIISRVFLLCTFVSFCGCTTLEKASNVDSLPESATTIGDNGMVFAEVHIVGKFADAADGMNVIVGGHSKGSVQKNAWAVALPAGDYTLEGFSRSAGGYGGGFGGVNVTVTNYESYPLQRSFTVKAGEIVNLGEIIVVPNPDPAKSREFKVFVVDNSSDVQLLLKAHYSKLDVASRPEAMTLSAGDYARGEDLTKLRRLIASVRAEGSQTLHYVAGPAGTLASVERGKAGAPARLRLIDTGLTVGLAAADEDSAHDRFAYTTSDGRFFMLRSGQIQQRKLPEDVGLQPRLLLAGDKNVAIVKRGFTFYTSTDDGTSWDRNDTVADKKSDTDFYSFAKDARGYFIYDPYPARLVYSPVGNPNFSPVTLPPNTKEIRHFAILKSGIVLEPATIFWSAKAPFYVRARDGGEWQARHLPDGSCMPMQYYQDAAGMSLRTTCKQVVYESRDNGENWSAL